MAYEELVVGGVDYRHPERGPDADWALPEKLAFIKPDAFAWQDEFRIAIGRRGAMDVHNVVCTLETGPAAAAAATVGLSAAPLLLRVGDMSEFADFHAL